MAGRAGFAAPKSPQNREDQALQNPTRTRKRAGSPSVSKAHNSNSMAGRAGFTTPKSPQNTEDQALPNHTKNPQTAGCPTAQKPQKTKNKTTIAVSNNKKTKTKK